MWKKPKVNNVRVILTTECLLKCSYCCNKLPYIQKTFKMTTLDQFLDIMGNYQNINITGGEPMLEMSKLKKIVWNMRENQSIYLYTTGLIKPEYWFQRFNCINIGVHNNFEDIKDNMLLFRYLTNVKLSVKSGLDNRYIRRIAKQSNMSIHEWKINECNKTEEDRFII